MTYNRTTELPELYFQQSGYSTKQAEPDYPPFLQWPSNSNFEKFKPDTYLFERALSSARKPAYSIAQSWADPVQEKQI